MSTKRLGFDVKARSILLAFDPKETLLTAHSWLFPMQNIRLCIATSMLNPGGPPKATHPAVRAVDAAYGKCLIVVPPARAIWQRRIERCRGFGRSSASWRGNSHDPEYK